MHRNCSDLLINKELSRSRWLRSINCKRSFPRTGTAWLTSLSLLSLSLSILFASYLLVDGCTCTQAILLRVTFKVCGHASIAASPWWWSAEQKSKKIHSKESKRPLNDHETLPLSCTRALTSFFVLHAASKIAIFQNQISCGHRTPKRPGSHHEMERNRRRRRRPTACSSLQYLLPSPFAV